MFEEVTLMLLQRSESQRQAWMEPEPSSLTSLRRQSGPGRSGSWIEPGNNQMHSHCIEHKLIKGDVLIFNSKDNWRVALCKGSDTVKLPKNGDFAYCIFMHSKLIINLVITEQDPGWKAMSDGCCVGCWLVPHVEKTHLFLITRLQTLINVISHLLHITNCVWVKQITTAMTPQWACW